MKGQGLTNLTMYFNNDNSVARYSPQGFNTQNVTLTENLKAGWLKVTISNKTKLILEAGKTGNLIINSTGGTPIIYEQTKSAN